jgi:hypothetical protein
VTKSRADIEDAKRRAGAGILWAVVRGPLGALEGAAGTDKVLAAAPVSNIPAAFIEQMRRGVAREGMENLKDLKVFLLAITETEIIEIHPRSRLMGGQDVHRMSLTDIREVSTGAPRVARMMGAKMPFLVVGMRGGSSRGYRAKRLEMLIPVEEAINARARSSGARPSSSTAGPARTIAAPVADGDFWTCPSCDFAKNPVGRVRCAQCRREFLRSAQSEG